MAEDSLDCDGQLCCSPVSLLHLLGVEVTLDHSGLKDKWTSFGASHLLGIELSHFSLLLGPSQSSLLEGLSPQLSVQGCFSSQIIVQLV